MGEASCVYELKVILLLNVHETQSDLQTQCNPYQIFNGLSFRGRKNNSKVHVEP